MFSIMQYLFLNKYTPVINQQDRGLAPDIERNSTTGAPIQQ